MVIGLGIDAVTVARTSTRWTIAKARTVFAYGAGNGGDVFPTHTCIWSRPLNWRRSAWGSLFVQAEKWDVRVVLAAAPKGH